MWLLAVCGAKFAERIAVLPAGVACGAKLAERIAVWAAGFACGAKLAERIAVLAAGFACGAKLAERIDAALAVGCRADALVDCIGRYTCGRWRDPACRER